MYTKQEIEFEIIRLKKYLFNKNEVLSVSEFRSYLMEGLEEMQECDLTYNEVDMVNETIEEEVSRGWGVGLGSGTPPWK